MKTSSSQFELYRYQILPVDRHLQIDLVNKVDSIEELLLNKNYFFDKALKGINKFESSRVEIHHKKLLDSNDFYLFRIAANRSLHREKKDFGDEYIDNWPSVLVAIWNDPEVQIIAVQKRSTAFQSTKSLVNIIVENLRKYLSTFHLTAVYEPIPENNAFWDIIDKYHGKIQKLEFDFITPNMANISGNLPENLKDFAKATNSVKNKLEIESDSESNLYIDKQNSTISALADYTNEGGGNVTVKVANLSKKIKTSRTIRHIDISDVFLQGSAEEIGQIIKELIK